MHHFVSQFELLLQDREMEEGRQEYQTKQVKTFVLFIVCLQHTFEQLVRLPKLLAL